MSLLRETAADPNVRRSLLALAHQAVKDAVERDRLPDSIPKEGIFAERRGVFVTLHVKGRLRGCIGVVESNEPLGEGIVHAAASAALHDPRFSSLRKEELSGLEVEISVLSPIASLRPEDVEIGTHGLLIVSGRNRGLLLPQVAEEHHLDKEQFLQETCKKAGLPANAWRDDDVEIFGFTCDVYKDDLPQMR